MAQLAKESSFTTNKPTTRLLAIQLIQEHNRIDVLRILHHSCHIVSDNASRLALSKSRLGDEELESTMTTIIFASCHLRLFEIEELVKLFQRMYGDKFVVRARSNTASVSNERVVKKLTRAIEESLIQQYLQAIIESPTSDKAFVPLRLKDLTWTKDSDSKIHGLQLSTVVPQPLSDVACTSPFIHEPTILELPQSSSTCSAFSISKLAPTLPIRIFRPNQRLEIAFDVRTKNPVYVMERLDGLTRIKKTLRFKFYEEERLPHEYRSTLCSFLQSGYDRGHMAPAADFGAESVKDTFNLCNVSPQDQTMNRSIWAKLEHWCRRIAKRELKSKDGKAVHVITGPVWFPTNQSSKEGQHQLQFAVIGQGNSLVHVPTHFFKVLVVSRADQIQKFACFLVPNQPPVANATLEHYAVHWDRLEAITGLQFFPNLATPKWKLNALRAPDSMSLFKAGGRMIDSGVPLSEQLKHLDV